MAEINERASTSEYSASPTSSASDDIRRMSDTVFEKVSSFVQGHIQGTVDDYKLLEDMNNVTAQRYADMKQVAETVSTRLSQLNDKCMIVLGPDRDRHLSDETLRPYLQQIDEIDEASKRMDAAVTTLDNYITAVESRLKKIQQQPATQ
ncbi:Protein BLOS-2 [Aphelenchoides avenae]|nr:Protein BLOS-2 [Aphelenchus avenae]